MALSIFADKANPPTQEDLADALGGAIGAWLALHEAIGARFAPVSATWGYGSNATGWGLRLTAPGRTILSMTPCDGHFLASFALGERAVAAAVEANLPARILAIIDGAPRYAEGRGVRLEVRDAHDVDEIVRLAEVKMAR